MIGCSQHRAEAAAWQCTTCARTLCPDCAEARDVPGAKPMVLCVHCGSLARVLTEPRRIQPYWVAYKTFLGDLGTPAGLTQLFAVALMGYLCSLLPGGVGLGLKAFVYASYFFQVINRAAHGEERLPLPADFVGPESFAVSTRYSFATLLIWGPALYYALRGVSWWELAANTQHVLRERLLHPMVFLLVALGLFYYPAALIAGAVAERIWAMLNPWITVRLILRIPGQYLATVGVVLALSLLDLLLGAWGELMQRLVQVPVVLPLLVEMVKLLPRLTMAFVLGRLVFQNAEHFGVARAEMLERALLPEAVPRGKRVRLSRSP